MCRTVWMIVLVGALVSIFPGCGEEYYATPEKTLNMYVNNRGMGSRQQYEACLHSFSKADQEWFEQHYKSICRSAYGRDCPSDYFAEQTTVWVDFFEPAGPNKTTIDSSNIDENAGTATLVVDGQEIDFVKEGGNWKIDGMFGMQEELEQKYHPAVE
jgi:hypothetical protein